MWETRSTFWLRGVLPAVTATVLLQGALFSPAAVAADVGAPQPPLQYDEQELRQRVPTGERWIRHFNEDLLPYWSMPEALGTPVGNFPTYRCNDGRVYNPQSPCPELQYGDPGVVIPYREYLRAISRQVFAYGIGYHVTGDERYLDYAYAGAQHIISQYLENNGTTGAYSYRVRDQGANSNPYHGPTTAGGPAVAQRTSQDLAYAVTGLGFLYYLTRDQSLLPYILSVKEHIFSTYYDAQMNYIRWVIQESPDHEMPQERQLVAQLDQVYAYMLLAAPTLPPDERAQWEDELVRLARLMIDQYYSPRQNMFWGTVTNNLTPVAGDNPPTSPIATQARRLQTPHTDFGHSVKTMWMIYMIGRMTGNTDLVEFGTHHATAILAQAYLPSTGTWARAPLLNGNVDPDKEWWISAELDQVAASFSMFDPNYAGYLMGTYDHWFTHMVDHENHEIWHYVSASTNQPYPCGLDSAGNRLPNCFPKQHSWKNSLHSFEHGLVGYITAQQFHNLPVTLHYAFSTEPEAGTVQPYFYHGQLASLDEVRRSASGRTLHRATFTHVR